MEDNKVTVVCYGKTKVLSREDAITLYKNGVRDCDGSEKSRYATVLTDLLDNRELCWDGVEIPKGYHKCPYCYGLARRTDKDILCEDCREVFGHTFIQEL